MTSLIHRSASTSAIRRRLSPHARSRRSRACGRTPYSDLQLERRQRLQLELAQAIVRSAAAASPSLRASPRAPRTGSPVRSLTCGECLVGQAREQRVGGVVDEPEVDDAAPDALADRLERHAGRDERLQDPRPPHVAFGERRPSVAVRIPSSHSRSTKAGSTAAPRVSDLGARVGSSAHAHLPEPSGLDLVDQAVDGTSRSAGSSRRISTCSRTIASRSANAPKRHLGRRCRSSSATRCADGRSSSAPCEPAAGCARSRRSRASRGAAGSRRASGSRPRRREPPAFRMMWASPTRSPSASSTSIRASMHVRIARPVSGAAVSADRSNASDEPLVLLEDPLELALELVIVRTAAGIALDQAPAETPPPPPR